MSAHPKDQHTHIYDPIFRLSITVEGLLYLRTGPEPGYHGLSLDTEDAAQSFVINPVCLVTHCNGSDGAIIYNPRDVILPREAARWMRQNRDWPHPLTVVGWTDITLEAFMARFGSVTEDDLFPDGKNWSVN